jgi:hypothetical protein
VGIESLGLICWLFCLWLRFGSFGFGLCFHEFRFSVGVDFNIQGLIVNGWLDRVGDWCS